MTATNTQTQHKLNKSIAPTENFFLHVNGDYVKNHKIPADRGRDGNFYELHENSEKNLRKILSDAKADCPLSKALYASFMNEEAIEKYGIKPIGALISELKEATTLPQLLDFLSRRSLDGAPDLISSGVSNNPSEPTRNILHFAQGQISLPDEAYYREDQHAEIRAKFVKHIENIFNLYKANGGKLWFDPASGAEQILLLESKIAKGHWDRVKCRDSNATHNLMTLNKFAKLMPNINVTRYLQNCGLNQTQHLKILDCNMPSYFKHLNTLWKPSNLDAFKIWALYHIISGFSGVLPKEFGDENFDFYSKNLSGVKKQRPRWKRGISLVDGALGEEIGKIYVERYFAPNTKLKMDNLIANLIEAYRQSILALDWMSETTKAKAIEKLSKFTPMVGFTTKWEDYEGLQLSDKDLLKNSKAISKWAHTEALKKIGEKVDKLEWEMTPSTVNAYYHPLDNTIVFPAAILQPPFFDVNRSDAENYGSIGAVIGHEIGHGFDDQGSEFNGDGELKNWWTAADKKKFAERTAQLVEQYDAFVPAQLDGQKDAPHVNGELTLGENIGDLSGVEIALKALALTKGLTSSKDLPDDEVRKFFISYAISWQVKSRDEALRTQIATDPHSPEEFRTNGIVRNIDAFHRAFKTKRGDAMYLAPAQRVRIWG